MRNVGNFLSRKPLRRNLMANRVNDRLSQAEGDLKHAANARKDGDYDWSCFAAQQAAEKALSGKP
jgi:HEPN domain-containing protein